MELALVTGATSGLGLALAREHASRGGDLVITARHEGALMDAKGALERDFGVRVCAIAQDLGAPGAAETLYLKVKSQNLSPSILINNAGVGCSGPFSSMPLDEILNLTYLNVVAPATLARLFLPELERCGGRILNVASVAALVPGPYMAPYYASKAYLDSLSLSLSLEERGRNVSVTCCLPGPMRTGFVKASRLKDSRISGLFTASAQKVAAKAYEAMMSGRRSVMPGVPLWMKAALAASPLLPKSLVLSIMGMLQKPGAR